NLSLLTTMSVGIISVPFDVDLPSPIANDIEKRASSPTCSPPIAHFHMHGPTMYGSDGGSITEETTSSQIAVSLNQDAQTGSAAIKTYEWKANGATIGSAPDFNWLASNGTWTITLTVTDAAGLTGQASGVVTVRNPNDQTGTWGGGTGGDPNQGPVYPEPSPKPDQPDLPPINGGAWVCQTTAQWVGRWDDGGQFYQEITDCYPAS